MYTALSNRSSGEGNKILANLGFKDKRDITYFLRDQVEDERVATCHGPIRGQMMDGVARDELSGLSKQSNPHARRLIVGGDPVYDEGSNSVRYQLSVIGGNGRARLVSEIRRFVPLPSLPLAHMAYHNLADALSASGIPGDIEPAILDTNIGYFVIATVTPDSRADVRTVNDKLAEVIQQFGVNGNN